MTVLVTGATGNVGSQVVRALRGRGAHVRAFARDPGAEVAAELAVGDFEDAGSIRAALAGADRVFLSSADSPRKVAHETAVIDAAAGAGVGLIVKASTAGADPDSPLAPLAWNGRIEAHLRQSAVPTVILRSSFYMTNVAAQVRDGMLIAPAGSGRIAMIDPRDIGAVAAIVLTTAGHAGRTYRLTGPEAITYERIAEELSLEYVDVREEAAREGMLASGMPDWLVQHLVGAFRLIRAGAFDEVTGTVRAVCGRDPYGFADFARA
jgi:uncharacterized protein YbjT (DUF2867 family)